MTFRWGDEFALGTWAFPYPWLRVWKTASRWHVTFRRPYGNRIRFLR